MVYFVLRNRDGLTGNGVPRLSRAEISAIRKKTAQDVANVFHFNPVPATTTPPFDKLKRRNAWKGRRACVESVKLL